MSSLPLTELTSRIGHSGVFHKDHVFLFGGFVNAFTKDKPLVYVNDLIQVDVSSRRWENKTTHNIGPSARNFHSSCLWKKDKGEEEMIVFGGKSNGFHRDVWSFNFDTCEWKLLEASNGEIISPRYGQSACIYGSYLVVFGGYDNNSFTSNELFIFNLESREWKLIELSNEIQGRYYHASVLDEETGDWYIYGGKSATNLVKDFVKIKLSTLDLDKATCQSEVLISELDGFAQRFGHSMVLEKSEMGKRIYSIGGCNKTIDYLDCIYIDLDDIKKGWEVTHTHSLSRTFKASCEEIGPVFHANVPFQVTNEDDNVILNYFVFGGTYQKTETPTATPQETNQVESKKKKKEEPLFNIEVFDNVMNDDIFRLVLSFMPVADLCKLELVSKKLRICKLTTEDQYWKDYYFQKINLFLEASKTYNYSYNKNTRAYETNYIYSELYSSYLKFTSNYKRRLIEVIGECMSKADKDHHKRTSYIEGLSQMGSDVYVSKEEILKYKLTSAVPSMSAFKIVQVGDGAVGKTCLWISLTTNLFPHEYVPTVFDNYSQNYLHDGKTFSLGLWDTAGPEDYDRLRPLSYPQTDLFFLSFSCAAETSMENVTSKWIPEIRHHCPTAAVALVCTKIDFRDDPILSRELLVKKQKKVLSFEQGELLARKMGCITYLETSALTGAGMKDLNEVMVKAICMWYDPSFKQIVKKNRTSNEKKNCSMQ